MDVHACVHDNKAILRLSTVVSVYKYVLMCVSDNPKIFPGPQGGHPYVER